MALSFWAKFVLRWAGQTESKNRYRIGPVPGSSRSLSLVWLLFQNANLAKGARLSWK